MKFKHILFKGQLYVSFNLATILLPLDLWINKCILFEHKSQVWLKLRGASNAIFKEVTYKAFNNLVYLASPHPAVSSSHAYRLSVAQFCHALPFFGLCTHHLNLPVEYLPLLLYQLPSCLLGHSNSSLLSWFM